MPEKNDFSYGESGGLDPEAEDLRQRLESIHKKLTGEDPTPVTNADILQFLRVINYNFLSLTRLFQTIVLKNAEMDTTLMHLELSTARMSKRLNQFFEANSMLDAIEEDFNVSGSAADNKFIF